MHPITKGVLIILGLLAIAFLTLIFGEPIWRGIILRHTIFSAINSASTVRAIEHSSRYDTPYLPAEKFKEEIYISHILGPEEVKSLKNALPYSSDYSGTIFKGCSFRPHHRIEAEQKDGTVFRFHICFACKELAIPNEDKRIFPTRWDSSLKSFFTKIGMHPDGPWNIDLERRE